MKFLTGAFASLMVLAFTTQATATDDINQTLVGKWGVSQSEDEAFPVCAYLEFLPGGKLRLTLSLPLNVIVSDGTYTVKDKSVTYKLKIGNMEKSDTITISKIDGALLETVNPNKKIVKLYKVKE